MSRIAILCPGRGSYTKATRGQIPPDQPFLERAERVRAEYDLPPLLELDRDREWSSAVQLSPEHVSPLIWLATMIDADTAMREHEPVCVGGNSMGWYTALAVAGALDFEDGFRLVDEQKGEVTFGGFFAALSEEVTDLAFRFTEPHVEDLGSLDIEEELRPVLACFPSDFLTEIMRGGFSE